MKAVRSGVVGYRNCSKAPSTARKRSAGPPAALSFVICSSSRIFPAGRWIHRRSHECCDQSAFHSRRFGSQENGRTGGVLRSADRRSCDPRSTRCCSGCRRSRLPSRNRVLVRKHLDEALAAAFVPIRSVNDPNARFIPDSMPQPLAIQVAANIDGSAIDKFRSISTA